MLVVNNPVGRIIALANLEENILGQGQMDHHIEDLVDLIKIRVQDTPIEEVANGLLENVFDLRFEVLEWLSDNDKDVSFFQEVIRNHIGVNLQIAPYSDLAKTISSVLLAYENILTPILEKLPSSFSKIFGGVNHKPDYETFKSLLSLPVPQIQYLVHWLDASLQFEIGLILSDLILTRQIEFPKERTQNELIKFLRNTIIRFGAYAMFVGLWKPDPDDATALTNSMGILSASIEVDKGIYHTTTSTGFYEMIENR